MQENFIKQAKQLQNLSTENFSPFKIKLPESILTCNQPLRIMQKKRLTTKGTWNNKKVVAKLFFSPCGKHYFKRELKGLSRLKKVNTPIPDVLFKTKIDKIYIIIFTFLEPDLDLDEIWLGEDEGRLKSLLLKMQEILIKQHTHGLFHEDIHPHNFLLSNDLLFMLDAAELKKPLLSFSEPSKKKALNNLVLLYSQLPIKRHSIILAAFKYYCELRNWLYTEQLEKKFFSALAKARYQRMKKNKKRCLRNCKEIVIKQSIKKYIAYRKDLLTPKLELFFANPDKYISEGKIIKAGNTCTVAAIKLDSQDFIVKRYNVKNTRHLLTHCFRRSRAIKSWLNSQYLKLLGIPTAKPVAVLENRWFILRGKTYFLAEYIDGILLPDFFNDTEKQNFSQNSPETLTAAENVAKKIVDLLKLFSTARISHKDLKATNFIVKDNKIFVLDVDAMRIFKNKHSFKKSFSKDLVRFMKNWQNNPKAKIILAKLLQQSNLSERTAWNINEEVK